MPAPQLRTPVRLGTDTARDAVSELEDELFRFQRYLILTLKSAETRAGASVESLPVPDPDEIVSLLRRGREAAEFQRRFMRDSYSAEPGDAVRDEDEEHPGKHKIIFRTKEGVETCYRGLPASGTPDPSSRDELATSRPVRGSDAANQARSPEDHWTVFKDRKSPAPLRVAAFTALRGSPFESAAVALIASELAQEEIEPDWRDAAVFVAEDTYFSPELREAVGEALLHIASSLRIQQKSPEKVTWSALRRGASLISRTRVERLLEFLAPGGAVDTRSVALQCISRMYEAEPPAAVPPAVADRALRFAERFLDPDVFTPGEPSLIARSAVSVLAALGDPRLADALREVRSLGRPWLVRRVSDELNRVYHGWVGRGFSPEQPAVANLGSALASFV